MHSVKKVLLSLLIKTTCLIIKHTTFTSRCSLFHKTLQCVFGVAVTTGRNVVFGHTKCPGCVCTDGCVFYVPLSNSFTNKHASSGHAQPTLFIPKKVTWNDFRAPSDICHYVGKQCSNRLILFSVINDTVKSRSNSAQQNLIPLVHYWGVIFRSIHLLEIHRAHIKYSHAEELNVVTLLRVSGQFLCPAILTHRLQFHL